MLPFILISILLYPQKVAMLSQRIFFLTFIGDTRIVRFAAISIGIIRIGTAILVTLILPSIVLKAIFPEKREYAYERYYLP